MYEIVQEYFRRTLVKMPAREVNVMQTSVKTRYLSSAPS